MDMICAGIHQPLHFIRLRVISFSKNIALIFYRATTESILSSGVTSFVGNQSVKSKGQILSLVKTAGKVMVTPAPLILLDSFHTLHLDYALLDWIIG